MDSQRINRFIASRLGVSRRRADAVITEGRVQINHRTAELGERVSANDIVWVDGKPVDQPQTITIAFHKPVGYVSSRRQQGETPTIYKLLPPQFHDLKPAGRLDKDSSGLMILSSDGQLIFRLTHPSVGKQKQYEVLLDKPLRDHDRHLIESGVRLDDGISKFQLDGSRKHWVVTMGEGRNRQIRRSFAAVGYEVIGLHRTKLGEYTLGNLPEGQYRKI